MRMYIYRPAVVVSVGCSASGSRRRGHTLLNASATRYGTQNLGWAHKTPMMDEIQAWQACGTDGSQNWGLCSGRYGRYFACGRIEPVDSKHPAPAAPLQAPPGSAPTRERPPRGAGEAPQRFRGRRSSVLGGGAAAYTGAGAGAALSWRRPGIRRWRPPRSGDQHPTPPGYSAPGSAPCWPARSPRCAAPRRPRPPLRCGARCRGRSNAVGVGGRKQCGQAAVGAGRGGQARVAGGKRQRSTAQRQSGGAARARGRLPRRAGQLPRFCPGSRAEAFVAWAAGPRGSPDSSASDISPARALAAATSRPKPGWRRICGGVRRQGGWAGVPGPGRAALAGFAAASCRRGACRCGWRLRSVRALGMHPHDDATRRVPALRALPAPTSPAPHLALHLGVAHGRRLRSQAVQRSGHVHLARVLAKLLKHLQLSRPGMMAWQGRAGRGWAAGAGGQCACGRAGSAGRRLTGPGNPRQRAAPAHPPPPAASARLHTSQPTACCHSAARPPARQPQPQQLTPHLEHCVGAARLARHLQQLLQLVGRRGVVV